MGLWVGAVTNPCVHLLPAGLVLGGMEDLNLFLPLGLAGFAGENSMREMWDWLQHRCLQATIAELWRQRGQGPGGEEREGKKQSRKSLDDFSPS